MEIFNFPQYSQEWWAIRQRKMTASHAQAIASNGKGLETYIRQIMAEYYSSAPPEAYSNKAMERGLEMEPQAADAYAWEYMADVKEVGFVVLNDYVGCSPDRFIGDDGLLEIKCPSDKVFFDLLLTEKIDTKYEWQIQMQLMITGRDWCDYTVFNPNFKDHLFVSRVYPDKDRCAKLEAGFEAGMKMIQEIEERMAA